MQHLEMEEVKHIAVSDIADRIISIYDHYKY